QMRGRSPAQFEERSGIGPLLQTRQSGRYNRNGPEYLPTAEYVDEIRRIAEMLHHARDRRRMSDVQNAADRELERQDCGGEPIGTFLEHREQPLPIPYLAREICGPPDPRDGPRFWTRPVP